MELEEFENENAEITEVTGKVIFAGYSLASVLVALNLLIAMLNNSYKKVDVSVTTQPKPTISRSNFTSQTRGFWLDRLDGLVRFDHRENTGSRLFTEVKLCWTGLISGWVTIWIKYPVLFFLRSQAGVVKTSITPSTSTTYVVCGLSFSRSQPDFEGFLRVLRFPPSAKSTPSLFHLAI